MLSEITYYTSPLSSLLCSTLFFMFRLHVAVVYSCLLFYTRPLMNMSQFSGFDGNFMFSSLRLFFLILWVIFCMYALCIHTHTGICGVLGYMQTLWYIHTFTFPRYCQNIFFLGGVWIYLFFIVFFPLPLNLSYSLPHNHHTVVRVHESFSHLLSPSTPFSPPITAILLSSYKSVSIFLISSVCQTIFQSDYTNLCFHQ